MIVLLSLQEPDIVEQLWRLQHAAYRLEAAAIGLKEYPPLGETFDSIRNSGERFYGAISGDGDLLGAIATAPANSSGCLEITRLMVHEEHLHQGIGASLLRHVLDIRPEITIFQVTAGALNVPAVSLYRKFGFAPGENVTSTTGALLTIFRYHRD